MGELQPAMHELPTRPVDETHEEILSRFHGSARDILRWCKRQDNAQAIVKTILLREIASMEPSDQPDTTLEERRREFSESLEFKEIRGNPCWCCGKPGVDRHHLIQLKNGGLNVPENVLNLCRYHHACIHPWMRDFDKKPKAQPKKNLKKKSKGRRGKAGKRPPISKIQRDNFKTEDVISTGGVLLLSKHQGRKASALSFNQLSGVHAAYRKRCSTKSLNALADIANLKR
jgi:hypothetical protein